MKVVRIAEGPNVVDDDGCIRDDITDLNKILSRIDDVEGRNDALREYIYRLRDLQHAHERSAYGGADADAKIDRAQAAVAKAFDRLIVCEFAINRQD